MLSRGADQAVVLEALFLSEDWREQVVNIFRGVNRIWMNSRNTISVFAFGQVLSLFCSWETASLAHSILKLEILNNYDFGFLKWVQTLTLTPLYHTMLSYFALWVLCMCLFPVAPSYMARLCLQKILCLVP